MSHEPTTQRALERREPGRRPAGTGLPALLLAAILAVTGWQALTLQRLERTLATTSGSARRSVSLPASKQLASACAALEQAAAAMRANNRPEPDATAVEPIDRAVEAAIVLSRLTDMPTRRLATEILNRLRRPRALARLRQLAEGDPDTSVRRTAFAALLEQHVPGCAKLLLSRLKAAGRDERRNLVGLLAGHATAGMEQDLLHLLKEYQGTDYWQREVRRQLYRALGNIGSPKLCAPLLKRLRLETDYGVQETVLQALKACATRGEIPLLVKTLLPLMPGLHNNLRRGIVTMATDLRDPRLSPLLIACLKSPQSDTVRQACDALMQLRDPLAATALLELYRHGSPEHRQRMQRRLQQSGYPGLRYEAKTKSLALVPPEAMRKLLQARKRRIEDMRKLAADGEGVF